MSPQTEKTYHVDHVLVRKSLMGYSNEEIGNNSDLIFKFNRIQSENR